MDIFWKIVATLGLVGLNAFFVAAEFAAVGARASRLETIAKTSVMARAALLIKTHLDLYLSTCQLGITIASLGLGAVTEPAVAVILQPLLTFLGTSEHLIHPISLTVALMLSTSLHVVVGEVAPKNWAILYPDSLLPAIAIPLVIFTYLLYPIIWLLNTASNGVLRLTGVNVEKGIEGVPHTQDELRTLLADAVARGTIPHGNVTILTSAFEFGELKVRQIMTPRTRVNYLLLGQPIGDLLSAVQKSAYTRLPLCDGDIDHVVGMVHMKDLFNHLRLMPGRLRLQQEETGQAVGIIDGLPGSAVHVIGSGDIDLRTIGRDVVFIPELAPVPKLLHMFQQGRSHMAVVVDEYGSTVGIVTMEDVLEQIVGEIEDEFDSADPAPFVPEGENYRVAGGFGLHELREKLSGLDELEVADVDTVGGYVTQQLGRWPRVGDTVDLAGKYTLRVVNVQQRRVRMTLISPVKSAGNAAEE